MAAIATNPPGDRSPRRGFLKTALGLAGRTDTRREQHRSREGRRLPKRPKKKRSRSCEGGDQEGGEK
jgi:hypothetical protein